jgi:predicted secreted hydrolase
MRIADCTLNRARFRAGALSPTRFRAALYPTWCRVDWGIKRNMFFYVLSILLLFSIFPSSLPSEDFRRALPGRTFAFPRDHFSHPEFKTEWWYYSGHLQTLDRNSFGYQLTFFRTALRRETKTEKSKWSIRDLYFAHLALTDESKKRFAYREKINRGSLGEAGATSYTKDKSTFRVWIEDWSLEGKGVAKRDHLLKGGDRDFGLELLLTPEKKPVVHGQNGISQKAEGEGYASHYYSITRLETNGKIYLKKKEIPVQGMSWMDHEFGSTQLRDYQIGWDWFSIQLENGVDLMIYQIRHRDGKIDPYSSGTIVLQNGNRHHLLLKEFQVQSLDRWKSPKSGATYPSKWRIEVPGERIELLLVPTVENQELITQGSTRVTYWEGSVKVVGKNQDQPVRGMGYVELTGYAKPLSGRM